MTKTNVHNGKNIEEPRQQSEVTLQCDVDSTYIQTDLTMDDLSALECEYQQRLKEIQHFQA